MSKESDKDLLAAMEAKRKELDMLKKQWQMDMLKQYYGGILMWSLPRKRLMQGDVMVDASAANELKQETEAPKKCGCGGIAQPPHECPFQHDVHGDRETLCECCEKCEWECLGDI